MDEKSYFDKIYKKAFDEKRKAMIEAKARKMAEEDAIEPSKALRFLRKAGNAALSGGKMAGQGFIKAMDEYQKISDNIDSEAITGIPETKGGDKNRKKNAQESDGPKAGRQEQKEKM
jgi:hypothetical protein